MAGAGLAAAAPLAAGPDSFSRTLTSGLSGVVIGSTADLRAMSLAMMVSRSTIAISVSAPAHARFCALTKPPVALPKICSESVDMR